ncbi:nitrate reductase [Octadecabacter sp. SW4]|uniref:nitrate reductase n=1 Tax=Octadecabacter sp. SW4 TaxID=2602067 RepID=UPI00155B2C92|nr:nitrate reductase [Octadecabacter sp. SW4]
MASQPPPPPPPDAATPTRYGHSGEIYLCIASLLRFAPWLGRIWIVTDDQEPDFLDDFRLDGPEPKPDIRLVDHRDIFRDHFEHLPTFNSLSIETMIWNIDGMAERFIYLNDDFFLNAPVLPNTFFHGDKPVVRARRQGSELTVLKNEVSAMKARLGLEQVAKRVKYRSGQDLAARTAGLRFWYYLVNHLPHPMRKSTLKNFYAENPQILARQIAHRFRHREQFTPWSLAYHLEIKAKTAVLHPEEVPFSPHTRTPDLSDLDRDDVRFGCAQSMDEWPENLRKEFKARMVNNLGDSLPASARVMLTAK